MTRRWTLGMIERLARANRLALEDELLRLGPDVVDVVPVGEQPVRVSTSSRVAGLLARIDARRRSRREQRNENITGGHR